MSPTKGARENVFFRCQGFFARIDVDENGKEKVKENGFEGPVMYVYSCECFFSSKKAK